MKKSLIITISIFITVIIFAILLIQSKNGHTDEEVVKCIGQKSTLYIQLGCHACNIQENMFGENKKFLETIDCFYEKEKCANITGTPTWIINNEKYIGVQSIKKLKELTKC
jgi:hypothetical protein